MKNAATFIRRELMLRIIQAFDEGRIEDELDQIALKLRPKNMKASRCCIYHDRAVLKYRLMALLGLSVEDETNEAMTLREYYADLKKKCEAAVSDSRELHPLHPLSVCGPACSGCPPSRVVSTPNCRGCFARPCVYNCPKQAITIEDGHSVIHPETCIKCGKCITVCPYHAIIKTTVPCEEACPVGAIKKDAQGVAEIDFKKCIYCGKCFMACPFSAVMERSQLLEVLLAMKRGEKVVAMLAPATCDQLGKVEKVLTACVKAGFSDAMEVALGAEMTTEHETKEFVERLEKNPKMLMTTSCCPAWVNLVGKHMPELIEMVSTTPSPMVFANEIVKGRDPAARTVFVGPCVAKRSEARRKKVDYVFSVEELAALFEARGVKVADCEDMKTERPANPTARNYSKSCGVTEAVVQEACAHIPGFKLASKQISGIDKKTCMMVKMYATGKLPANFLEVMACPGGCVHGPVSLTV